MPSRSRAPLHAAALERVQQLVARDPEQPVHGGAALGVEPVQALERARERLSRQVGAELRVARAADEVPEHRCRMPAVEARERVRVGASGDEERLVRGGVVDHP
jgi:hypothetical protein